MEKAHLVAQPFQLIARQRREACRLSGSGGRDNERGLLTMVMPFPPKRGHLCTPWHTRSAIVVLSVSKRESGTELQKVSCCVQGPGETSETWTLYSNGHGVVAARRTNSGNLPLPFSTTRLLGAKAKALIPTGSL